MDSELALHTAHGWDGGGFQRQVQALGLSALPSASERVETWNQHLATQTAVAEQQQRVTRTVRKLHTQLDHVSSSVDGAVSKLRSRISTLELDIRVAESSIQQKSNQIDSLVSSIESRKRELEREYENKRNLGLLGAIFGAPMVTYASLFSMMQDDGRLQSLESELARAKADQSSARAKVDSYRRERQQLDTALSKLQAREVLAPTVEALRDNLTAQVAILTQVRDAAYSLDSYLGQTVQRLETQLEETTQLVDASVKETRELLKIMTSDDPELAAVDWMKGKLKAPLKARVSDVIDRALEALPAGSPAASMVKRELMSQLFR